MSTETTSVIVSTSSEATEELGRKLGSKLKGGEVIELRSDLGGGKTTFVRGLAAGMGSPDAVASPSFTISRVYTASKLELHHYDFYRLAEAGLMSDELGEVLTEPHNVTIVEWADIVENVLPPQHIEIDISVSGENERQIAVSVPAKNQYLKEALV
jgi:tRNA threonylcarbamoyladenosine biosynthesis protein TsaE